ncbi:WecB/TagA/CpsF family glycosyltransferase [Terracoccus luteus]|uniref:Exopolysaccharide biosynthesis WecB/TagA/CpsF family protein n=1 Tax=Terracoccus luteus TaxID=53356 RepID=A0A839PRM6_9MICO|nr:WecB/TagA/CpsF family glycosyltransferase [Terracoccus luteus]MBB2985729.1 exopolysaccharide biosynthesis WecB/TagA/CpsF family protein [Terracoccus luteus]MCP2171381.1 exopolysaccharide biosynthesis WecB/TagA/CpsF family protein [Terracoccus luteus]
MERDLDLSFPPAHGATLSDDDAPSTWTPPTRPTKYGIRTSPRTRQLLGSRSAAAAAGVWRHRPAHEPQSIPRPAPPGRALAGQAGTELLPPSHWARSTLTVAGFDVHLRAYDGVVDEIGEASVRRFGPVMAVASANLDHVYHFGRGGLAAPRAMSDTGVLTWLTLLDGIPIVAVVRGRTGVRWPRLAGADLLVPVLARAEQDGIRVGFLGGQETMHVELRRVVARDFPQLVVSGYWAPDPSEVDDRARSDELAEQVRHSRTDLLVVGLGKPRQEVWIQEHGEQTGARVLLAFGASADFLAGQVKRAPAVFRETGMEWAYRLAMEPRRLAHRYLVDGPVALSRLVR